ncbi:MAG: RNA-binding transcriptional accessory protein, partial [Candidatus Obscuribacterales bacterium]|nr:RNA-binding transcriptional accessory protein [Candidatus Obscuribacterales bacterium]
MDYAKQISQLLNLRENNVVSTLALLAEGATVPFIARYRKEATGSLDEVAITDIRDLHQRLVELDKRRQSILDSLKERELLTDELEKKLLAATTLSELEDIYLPFRPKRRTKATVAREKGLEPLAKKLFQGICPDPHKEATTFINDEKGVANEEEALAGARDIIAEWASEDERARKKLRLYWSKESRIESKAAKGKEEEGAKYKDYFDWSEHQAASPSHRVLAMFRGECEGFLKLSIAPPLDPAIDMLDELFVRGETKNQEQIESAIDDAYKRLLAPSMETELRNKMKSRADEEAIAVFVTNLRELLMAPVLPGHCVMAVDPGFRTGCKTVCLSERGELLHNDVIYPLQEGGNAAAANREKAIEKVVTLCKKHKIDAIAVGNGTASRETEAFLKSIDYKSAGLTAPMIVMVNESGASIYSASKVARDEFPDHDITVRGAVSIGRRLIDPLAELVKLDPKSIGVGQYQHDVDQGALQTSLDDTVVSCVNSVGVELNTASKELLSYVSGLGNQLAGNIIKHRQEAGSFKSRRELSKVARLGPKAFEQCAGFLRIREAKNPLDASAVHPERYGLVEQMARDLGATVKDLMENTELRKRIDKNRYVSESVGLPTLNDILEELEKPGRDPRETLEAMEFADGVHT